LRANRRGDYDEYNAGTLEMYTLGFNRTGNVTDEIQPNASTANLRRIGGPHFTQYQGLSLANRDEAAMRCWHEWDRASLLASVREFASGTDRFLSYRVRFHQPKITFALQGEELFTIVDHRAALRRLCGIALHDARRALSGAQSQSASHSKRCRMSSLPCFPRSTYSRSFCTDGCAGAARCRAASIA
jgi:hypothetical protein